MCGRPSFLALLCALLLCLLCSRGYAQPAEHKIRRVVEVSFPEELMSPETAYLSGVYELWDALPKGTTGVPGYSYFYRGVVGDRRVTVEFRLTGALEISEVILNVGGSQFGHWRKYNAFESDTLTYVSKVDGMPATVDFILKQEPSSVGGPAGEIDFGDDPDDPTETPIEAPEIPEFGDGPTGPTYTYRFSSNPFDGGESEMPEVPDEPLEWNPLELPEIETTTMVWNMPLPTFAQGSSPYMTISTNPLVTFGGTAYGGIWQQLDVARQWFRLILSLASFWVFVRSIIRTLVYG